MEQLPSHVATADEPLPPYTRDPLIAAPDLHEASPLNSMIEDLHQFDDDVVSYVDRFREHMKPIGLHLMVEIDRDGADHLMVTCPVDGQVRHRNRYVHFLFADLDAVEGRRDQLFAQLMREGYFFDSRPTNPREVTKTVRRWLNAGGRLLLNPDGRIEDTATVPRLWSHGSDKQRAECASAMRAYYAMLRRWRCFPHLKRIARMLGTPTSNGWIVLETKRRAQQVSA